MTRRRDSLLAAAPLVVLAVAVAGAAGAGIARQPAGSHGSGASSPTVSYQGTGTLPPAPPCPSPTIAARPVDGTVAEEEAWVALTLEALADRVQCTDSSKVDFYPWGVRPEYSRYTGIELDRSGRRLVVHWKGPIPKVVRERVGDVPRGVVVVLDPKAPYSSDEVDRAVALLTPGDVLLALPPIPGRAAGAPDIVLTGIVAREDGRAVEVGYAYADGTLPPRSDVTPAEVAAPLRQLAGGVRVVAIPSPLLEP
jgi:hypothetical protein